MRRGGSHLVFPSRVDTFKLSGPGLSWREALFEGGLRRAVLHADSSSIGSYGVSLARITRASWCLWCSACIPGLGWIPGAISITNCIVMMPLIRGVTGLLALWPVALASSSISWKYLRTEEYNAQGTLALEYHQLLLFSLESVTPVKLTDITVRENLLRALPWPAFE